MPDTNGKFPPNVKDEAERSFYRDIDNLRESTQVKSSQALISNFQ